MAIFNGEIVLAEEDKSVTMQDAEGRKVPFALLGWAQSMDERTYIIMQTMDGSMNENEALVFLQDGEAVELVTDMELVESIFDAYNHMLGEEEV